jgi:hypothetical protein
MDSDSARQLIRRRLQEGQLPRGRAVYIRVVTSDGQSCDGCGESIAKQQIVWAIRTPDWTSLQFHDNCYPIWDVESHASSSHQDSDGRPP